jgi:uncharacterized small protein (TIGR04563 family)
MRSTVQSTAMAKAPPDPDQKYEHPLFWPEDMLDLIQRHAVRCDQSLSFMVQLAWTTQYAKIAASDRETLAAAIRAYKGTKRKQSLFYLGSMLQQFEEQAKRLDSSESFVVQAAVAMAVDEFEKLPSFEEV